MTRTNALLVMVLVLVAAAGFADFRVFELSGTQSANQRADTQALCSLKADLQRRVVQGYQFLVSHPRGIPGIPAALLRSSIDNQQHTLTALKPLICP